MSYTSAWEYGKFSFCFYALMNLPSGEYKEVVSNLWNRSGLRTYGGLDSYRAGDLMTAKICRYYSSTSRLRWKNIWPKAPCVTRGSRTKNNAGGCCTIHGVSSEYHQALFEQLRLPIRNLANATTRKFSTSNVDPVKYERNIFGPVSRNRYWCGSSRYG